MKRTQTWRMRNVTLGQMMTMKMALRFARHVARPLGAVGPLSLHVSREEVHAGSGNVDGPSRFLRRASLVQVLYLAWLGPVFTLLVPGAVPFLFAGLVV
jgi:hypothetical protein